MKRELATLVPKGQYESLYAGRSRVPLWGPQPGRLVARIHEWCKSGEILDIGCGDGKNALFLEGKGFSVTGVDVSRAALRLLEQRFSDAGRVPAGEYFEADVESWSPVAQYDALLSYGLYHCMSPDMRALRHRYFQQRVRPGGTIIFCSLSDGLPVPEDHLTPGLALPGQVEIESLWAGHEVLEHVVGQIEESHPPYVSFHRHEVTWVVARAAL